MTSSEGGDLRTPNSRRVPTLAFLAALVATVGLLAGAGSAQAASGPGCAKKAVCLWSKPNFEGKKVVVKGVGTSNLVAQVMNNEPSSVKNRFSRTILLYARRNGEGESRCVQAKGSVADLAGSYQFDDKISSVVVPSDKQICV